MQHPIQLNRIARPSLAAFLALGLLDWAVAVSAAEPPPRAGSEIYHEYCSVCHGDLGDGKSRAGSGMRPPPLDFTETGLAERLGREQMISVVRMGKPGTAMAGWSRQLNPREIEAVVDHIVREWMGETASSAHQRGQQIYAETCAVCHGDDGRGARWTATNMQPPPRNFARPETTSEISRAQMIRTAMYGKPDTAMPGFSSQYSQDDLEATIDYILGAFVPRVSQPIATREGRREAALQHADSGALDMAAALPNELIGSSLRGAALYMANCMACHGTEGDGRGPRAYFILPKPRNFQHPGSQHRYNRPALYRAIARGSLGTEMAAWDTVLDDQQIADVAEYVFLNFIQNATPEAVTP